MRIVGLTLASVIAFLDDCASLRRAHVTRLVKFCRKPNQNNVWYGSTTSPTAYIFIHGIFSSSRSSGRCMNRPTRIRLEAMYGPQLLVTDPALAAAVDLSGRLPHPIGFRSVRHGAGGAGIDRRSQGRTARWKAAARRSSWDTARGALWPATRSLITASSFSTKKSGRR